MDISSSGVAARRGKPQAFDLRRRGVLFVVPALTLVLGGWLVLGSMPLDWGRDAIFAHLLATGILDVLLAVVATGAVVMWIHHRQMARELEASQERNAELELRNRELEAFGYSVAHDLRTPLRALDGFARILDEDHGTQLDGEGRDCTLRIRKAAQRMTVLVDDMLMLSQITQAELEPDDVNLSALALETAAALQASAPGRQAKFDIAPDVSDRGDPRLLRIALENLLGNAWKFTARRPSAHIAFGRRTVGGRPAYFVRDNGIGFDMAQARELFAAFRRLHPDDAYPGTGIGLATVQRVIDKHGGRVWAEGVPGEGATFYFTL